MDGNLVNLSEARRALTPPEPRMAPEQLEQLAAIVYAAHGEYAWRCLGEPPVPEWGRAAAPVRELWMRRVAREVEGRKVSPVLLASLQLSEVRRYRLLCGVVAALTAAA